MFATIGAKMIAKTSAIQPLLPPLTDALRAQAEQVVVEASTLRLPPETEVAFRSLLQQMGCYYSNLIEGVHTHPLDIRRAMQGEFSQEPERRRIQLLASGHTACEVELEAIIKKGASPFDVSLAAATHQILYINTDNPREAVNISPPEGDPLHVEPGSFRNVDVAVGNHVAPPAENIVSLLLAMDRAYSPPVTKTDRLIAVAAHHHRFTWVHPFLDGNGRTARLLSQGALHWVGIASPIWSIARGLAKQRDRYYAMLAYADSPRQGDLDGRGNLSERALTEFVHFFLGVCLDQIVFMRRMLGFDPSPQDGGLKTRIAACLRYMAATKGEALLKEEAAIPILHAFATGEVTNAEFERMTGLPSRTAQRVLKTVVNHGFLRRGQKRGVEQPFHFDIPLDALPLLFPGLHDAAGSGQ